MTHERQSSAVAWIFGVVVILLLIGIAVFAWMRMAHAPSEAPTDGGEVACTLEAKLCPDGSYVGRSGPHCEFDPCPEPTLPTSTPPFEDGTSTTTDEGLTFQYPEDLGRSYISVVDWPPQLTVSSEEFSCIDAGNEVDRAGKTERRTINGRPYCVTTISEGAAGSVYLQYAYAFPAESSGTETFTFTLREVQCANYDEPEQRACEAEQLSFDLDSIVDTMARSISGK